MGYNNYVFMGYLRLGIPTTEIMSRTDPRGRIQKGRVRTSISRQIIPAW